jgi:filamentous hemagglutinin
MKKEQKKYTTKYGFYGGGLIFEMINSGLTYAEREYTTTINGATVKGVADDIKTTEKGQTAVEAKYVDDWPTSLRNPQSPVGSKPWAVAEQNNMLNQAQKYSSGFDNVVYHTNSVELATYYTDMFTNAGIKNFEFQITPIK